MDASPVRVHHYAELLAVVRARVAELNISHQTLDHIAGLPSGYAGQILCEVPRKRMGGLSQFLILGALGLSLEVHEDTEALERVRSRLVQRSQRHVRKRTEVRMIVLHPDLLRLRAQRGGLAYVRNTTPQQRSKAARHAARARWRA
jgi:hypothetical protein